MVKAGDFEVKSPISEQSLNAFVNGINGIRKSPQKTSRHSVLKKNAENRSFDSNILRIPDSPTISTKSEVYSYGRRDSLNRTRFLLVRTSSGQGKESFKRVTLPGGSTVESLKFTIEKAMKTGRVSKVFVLPGKIPIEKNEQICELTDSQKVEVAFEEYDWLEYYCNSVPTDVLLVVMNRRMFAKIQQRDEYSLINMHVVTPNCVAKDSEPEGLWTARDFEHCQAACHSEFLLYKRPLNKIIEAKIVLKPLYTISIKRNLLMDPDLLNIFTKNPLLWESDVRSKGQELDSSHLDESTDIDEKPRNSPTEKTFCEKKVNGKVARWSGSETLESNEETEKTIFAKGQRQTLAEKFRIPNGFGSAIKEPFEECSFILPPFNQHALIILKSIVNNSTRLDLKMPSEKAETGRPETSPLMDCSVDNGEKKIDLNCTVQSTSETTKETYQQMNGKDAYLTHQKAARLLGFFGNKAVDEQVGDVVEEFKIAQVILIVAGIGGAIGIGYYFYSRYK